MDAEADLSAVASAQDARCIVLVYWEDIPVGCGFAIRVGDRRLLLTCAHVVNAALGRPVGDGEFPAEASLRIAPWFARDEHVQARVLPGGWHPISPDGSGDVALLEPHAPLSARIVPAPLRPWAARAALPFQVLGFPEGYKKVGQHAVGGMTGGFGPRGQWVQLDGETSRGARITRGFSGSAVWDTSTQTVAGIVVAEDLRDTTSPCGAMLPIEVVAQMVDGVREAFQVVAHPLSAVARHVGAFGELPLVGDVPASTIGATATAYDRHPAGGVYVERDLDAELQSAIAANTFVVVVGPSKAGKTRTAWEATRGACTDHVLLEPRDRSALVRLLSDVEAILDGRRVLVWLDGLERFLGREGERGLDLDLLDIAARRVPRWRVVATIRDKHHNALFREHEAAGTDWRRIDAWDATATFYLPVSMSERERVDAELAYPDEDFRGGVGIGERLIAGPELLRKLDDADNPFGWAIVRAAVDWTRTGLEEPASIDDLVRLADAYLDERFPLLERSTLREAIDWVKKPAVSHVALATVEERADLLVLRPLDYIVAAADGQGSRARLQIAADAWSLAVERSEGLELFTIFREATLRDDPTGMLAAAPKAREKLAPRLAAFAAAGLGSTLVDLDRSSEALDPLHQAVNDGDESIRAHALADLARALRHLKHHEETIEAYQLAIASNHSHTVESALIDLGELYEELGDNQSAITTYESAIARSEPAIASRGAFHKALVLRKSGEPRAAAAAALAAALAEPDAVLWIIAGSIAVEANQRESAAECFANAIDEANDRPELIAQAAYQRGLVLQDIHPELAEGAYRTSIERGMGKWSSASALMLANLVTDLPERVALIDQAARSEDSEVVATALVALATVSLERGDAASALDAAERCARLDPQLIGSEYATSLAAVFRTLHRPEQARGIFEQVRTIQATSSTDDATLGLADLHIEQGAFATAVDLLRPLADHSTAPTAARAGTLLGKALVELGEFERGIEAYRAAADQPGPDGRAARDRLGFTLWFADRPEEALEALRPLLDDSDPRLCAHSNLLTGLSLEPHDPQAAAQAFRRAVGTGHTHCVADAHLHLGEIAETREDREAAIDHYRAALEARITGTSTQAALKLKTLLLDRGERQEAIDLLTRAVPELESCGRLAYNLGILLREEGHLNRALLRFEDALAAAESDSDELMVGVAGRNLAALAAQNGDMDAYEDALRRTLDAGDRANSAAAGADLARRMIYRQDITQAIHLLQITISKDDESTAAPAWVMLADLLRMEGRATDAFTALKRAEEVDASGARLAEIELTRGALAYGSGDLDSAEAAFIRAAGLGPTEDVIATAAFDLALIRWDRGDRPGAEDDLRALFSNEVHAIAHASARALADRIQPDQPGAALAILEELAQQEPLCVHAQAAAVDAGAEYLERGQPSLARPLLERGMAGPVHAHAEVARLVLAELEHKDGNADEAVKGYRALHNSEYEHVARASRVNLGELLVEIGRLDEAEATLLPLFDAPTSEFQDQLSCVFGDLLLRRERYDESRRLLLDAADSDDTEVSGRAAALLADLKAATRAKN
ncbi:tetratricopeptide repeat protein [Kribbella speibonae]|uniref:Tetratricopeptide repeat protein n=1 Tax=Kribbella speibonae TaxID=1572660 RepID=A0ABY2ABQ2_9ACTN|nr:tetratricopeptide repeat protein [Kribbella speibonae]TCC25395.1 tetratricopeptide repeat protein [Kribbella speibonae]